MIGAQSVADYIHPAAAVAFADGQLNGLAETRPIVLPNHEPVQHHP